MSKSEGCFLQTLNAGCFVVFIVIAVIVISAIMMSNQKTAPSRPANPTALPNPPTPTDALQSGTPRTTQEEPEPSPEPASLDWELRREELRTQFLREFTPPQVGSSVSLKLKHGSTMEGVVKNLTEDEIQIQRGPATIAFVSTQLSLESSIRCFAADYVTFKTDSQLSREKREFRAKRQAEEERKLAEQMRRAEQERRRAEEQRAQQRLLSAQLVLYDWRWATEHGYVTVEGRVANISGQKIQNVEALAQFYTSEKTFITSDSALIEYNPLMPGQVSPFKVMLLHNPMMKTANVSFKSLWGGTLNYITKEEYDKTRQ